MTPPEEPPKEPPKRNFRKEGETAPLGLSRDNVSVSGTRPIGKDTGPQEPPKRPPMDPNRLRRLLSQAVAQSERIVSMAEARVELLVHALKGRNIPIPGVERWEPRHAITANGKNIITYLEKRFIHVPELAKQVQVACFRFHELAVVLPKAQEAIGIESTDDEILEDLRRKTYFVTHLYDHFKDDPLLRQLFPPPAAPPKNRTGNIGTDQITRYRAARDACGKRAEALVKWLHPLLERPRHILALAKQERGSSLLSLLSPADQRERAVIKKLRQSGQFTTLEEVVALVEKIPAVMTKVMEGSPYEPLEELIERMVILMDTAAADETLKDVLPAMPQELRQAAEA